MPLLALLRWNVLFALRYSSLLSMILLPCHMWNIYWLYLHNILLFLTLCKLFLCLALAFFLFCALLFHCHAPCANLFCYEVKSFLSLLLFTFIFLSAPRNSFLLNVVSFLAKRNNTFANTSMFALRNVFFLSLILQNIFLNLYTTISFLVQNKQSLADITQQWCCCLLLTILSLSILHFAFAHVAILAFMHGLFINGCAQPAPNGCIPIANFFTEYNCTIYFMYPISFNFVMYYLWVHRF